MTIKNKMLLGALLLVTGAAWAAPQPVQADTSEIVVLRLSSFTADFVNFKPGDTVPQKCTVPMSTTFSSGR